MRLHYADAAPASLRRALGLPSHGFCGEPIDDHAQNWTTVRPEVTCMACVHAMLSVAMRDLGELRAQAARLYERELSSR